MARIAVVLFNLGGPDSLDAVKPFLFNLFNDPAIISLAKPLRKLVANFIATARNKKAKAIYEKLGGKSPIRELTELQARKLEEELEILDPNNHHRCFVAMRYWHPFIEEAVQEVRNYDPDEVVLLPLYPQFSTTTTASSLQQWFKSASKYDFKNEAKVVCCYPEQEKFIAAHVDLIKEIYHPALKLGDKVRILFSAHGLPERIIEKGDPYQWQVEHTVKKIMRNFPADTEAVICYQSKVGPLKWLAPSTENEIKRAGIEGKSIILVPITFVSEHSETLVELDIEYKKLAEEHLVPNYYRVPALATSKLFIESLAEITMQTLRDKKYPPLKICPTEFCECFQAK